MKVSVFGLSAVLATLTLACQQISPSSDSFSRTKDFDSSTTPAPDTDSEPAPASEVEGYQSFAFYEGIPANGRRSLSRKDGTSHGMPCITKAVIEKGEEVKYDFWHGHNRELHTFKLTSDDLTTLKSGKYLEVFTAVVDGHKHAVKIDLEKTCKVAPAE